MVFGCVGWTGLAMWSAAANTLKRHQLAIRNGACLKDEPFLEQTARRNMRIGSGITTIAMLAFVSYSAFLIAVLYLMAIEPVPDFGRFR